MGAKSDKTKQALAYALEEMLTEMPLRKISVRALTQRAHMDRQTFYYHFTTMDDLARFVCDQWISRLSDALRESDTMQEMFTKAVRYALESKTILLPLLEGVGRTMLRDSFYHDVHELFDNQAKLMIEAAGAQVDRDAYKFSLQYCQYASVFLMLDIIRNDEAITATPEEVAKRLCATFEQQIQGLIASSGKEE